MVSFLKREDTIQGWLKEYSVTIIVTNLLMMTVILVLFFFMLLQHKKDVTYFLQLDFFYEEVDTFYGNLKQGIVAGSIEEINNEMEEMQNTLDVIKTMKGGKTFQRSIDDLKQLFEGFKKNVIEFYFFKDNTENSLNAEELYGVIQEQYKFISNDFKEVYSETMNAIRVRENRQFKINLCIILSECIFLGLLVYLEVKNASRFLKKITKPLMQLVNEVKNLNLDNIGDSNCFIQEKNSYEEVYVLSNVFHFMKKRLNNQMEEIINHANLKIELQKKEMDNLRITNLLRKSELKALQMQINPHFLFNTLNIIANTAYQEDAMETVTFLENTADYLRYILDHSVKTVSLEMEFDALGKYIYIQEQRFGKRLCFFVSLDESFHQVKVPSLILQPIVENSIIHGLGNSLDTIKIEVISMFDRQESRGLIVIRDNGRGIEQEKLKKIQTEICENKEEHIGLGNVYKRLQYFYNGDVEFSIASKVDIGTEVKISIPVDIVE